MIKNIVFDIGNVILKNPYTHEFVSKSNLLEMVDGYVFSYQEHMIKPYVGHIIL